MIKILGQIKDSKLPDIETERLYLRQRLVSDAEDIFAKDALWEPGHVEYVNLKVSNLGNLALTYKLGINIASEKKGVCHILVNDRIIKGWVSNE